MAWHGQSEYADSRHFAAMDRNGRARFRFLAGEARRAGRITAAQKDVAEALLRHHGDDGRCDPTHGRIARVAECSARTVARALDALRDCGLVAWTRRIVRTRQGARQTSSAYRLRLAGLTAAPIPRPKPTPSSCASSRNAGPQEPMRSVAEQLRLLAPHIAEETQRRPESLAEIRARRAAELAAMWRK